MDNTNSNTITVDPRTKGVIPGLIARITGGDAAASAPAPLAPASSAPSVGSSLPLEVAAAATQSAAPAPTPAPPPDLLAAMGDTQPTQPSDPAAPYNAAVASLAAPTEAKKNQPVLAPPPTPPTSFGQKLQHALAAAAPLLGGLEVATTPLSHQPVGVPLMERQIAAKRAGALKQQELAIEKTKADAQAEWMRSRSDTAETIQQLKNTGSAANTAANVAGRTAVAGINKRFIAVPQVGMFDTQDPSGKPTMIPGSSPTSVTVTPDIAKDYNMPQQLVGKQIPLMQFAMMERGGAMQMTTVQGASGPALVNKNTAQTKSLGLGSPALAGPTNVIRIDPNTNAPYAAAISKAEQLRTGEPTASTEQAVFGPTSQMKNMSQMAATVTPHLDVLRQEITELAPYLGPVMGRWNDLLAGKIGSTGNAVLDQKMGRLISDLKLASSAVGRTHFAGRTGLPASQYFEQLFNMARSPEELQGILQSVPQYIEGYAAASNERIGTTVQNRNAATGGGAVPKGNVNFSDGTNSWAIPTDKVAAFQKSHPNAKRQ